MLLVSFKIYSSLLEGVFVVSTAASDINQKSKTETQVQARPERSIIFKKSFLVASERG